MPLTLSMLSFGGCQTPSVKTVEVPVSSHCEGNDCFQVTRAFMDEHGNLLVENIRLKAALKFCNQSIEQNR